MPPYNRWNRPLTNAELAALFCMWCAITADVLVAVMLFL